MHLSTVASVEKEGYIDIIGDGTFVLPPGQSQARLDTSFRIADLTHASEVDLWAIFPHMDTLGRRMDVWTTGADWDACLVRVPRWDFGWQQFFFYERPVLLTREQTLHISCGFDTSSRDEPVRFGEGTLDEMCLIVVYATVR